jgi:RNA polymerase sigma factor (TIGR02999 family)
MPERVKKPSIFLKKSSMPTLELNELSELLMAAANGDVEGKERLFAAVYDELRRIAGRLMRRERADHTLQPTALVHEAVLQLLQGGFLSKIPNRHYFFAAATNAMRRILLAHHEKRTTAKRGGTLRRVPLDDVLDQLAEQKIEVGGLIEALNQLEKLDERQAQIVTLRYLNGCTIAEVADLLDVSESTVEGDWRFARAWLHDRLKREEK